MRSWIATAGILLFCLTTMVVGWCLALLVFGTGCGPWEEIDQRFPKVFCQPPAEGHVLCADGNGQVCTCNQYGVCTWAPDASVPCETGGAP